MNGKGARGEVEVESGNGSVGEKHEVRAENIVKASPEDLGGHKYRRTCHESLKGGEYLVYVVGSIDTIHGIYGKGYDFTVE